MAVKMVENETNNNDNNLPPQAGFFQPRRISLFIQCIVTLTISLSISLYAPFYPQLAETKSASPTVYGFVLGANCLTAFIVTPFIGRNLQHIGIHFAYIAGICINGVCCLLTGFLDQVPPGISFITLSIAIRVIHAIGNAGVITASFSFLANDYPNSLAIVFALNRFVMNIGQLVGPALGGALFEIGGFRLPFITLGLAQIVTALISFLFLPNCEVKTSSKPEQKSLTICNVFKIPAIYIAFTVFIVSTMANGFLSITLEPQILRKYNLNQFYMGVIFGIKDGASSLFTPVWGFLCNNSKAVKPCILVSCIIMITSFVILAPFPGLDIDETKILVCFALGLYGTGIAGLQVSGVICAFHEVIDYGYPDDAGTHGVVAGLWSSFSGLGRFVSRSTAGILVDVVGFQMSTVFVIGLLALVILLTSIYMCIRLCHVEPKEALLDGLKPARSQTRSRAISGTDFKRSRLLTSCEFHRSHNFVDAL